MSDQVHVDRESVSGWSGVQRVAFRAVVPHGKGTREIHVLVDPSLICEIADLIRATGCTDGDIGHALYHLNCPELQVPCSSCRTLPDPQPKCL